MMKGPRPLLATVSTTCGTYCIQQSSRLLKQSLVLRQQRQLRDTFVRVVCDALKQSLEMPVHCLNRLSNKKNKTKTQQTQQHKTDLRHAQPVIEFGRLRFGIDPA